MKTYDKIMNSGLYSTQADYPEFRHMGCDVCAERLGKRLGGDVYPVRGYTKLETAQKWPEDYYEFWICNGCLCAYVNGESFPEEYD